MSRSLVVQELRELLTGAPRVRCTPPVAGSPAVEFWPAHPGHVVTAHEVDPSAVALDDHWALALAAAPPGTALLAHLTDLARRLAGPQPVELSDAVLVEAMAGASRQAAQATALLLRFGAELEHRRRTEAEAAAARAPGSRPWSSEVRVFTAEEVAARLHTSTGEAQVLVGRAEALARPGSAGAGVLDALEVGAIDPPKAAQLADALAALPERTAEQVAATVLPGAGRITRRGLARRTAAALIAVDPAAAAERARVRRAERGVRWWAEDDGQACLQLRGPADAVATLWGALDARARAAQAAARDAEREAATAEGRLVDRTAAGTLDEHRFDAAVAVARDVLEGAHGPVVRTAASRPVVHVTVPASVLLGVDERAAWLHGYGAIDAEAARALAADATWRRILTDPATGVAVDVGEATYRPSLGLQRLVAARHRTCTAPGCGAPAWRCELDHRTAWPEGPTSAENLHPLCKRHHLMKHAPGATEHHRGWTCRPECPVDCGRDLGGGTGAGRTGGSATWTTPSGHTHRVDPEVLDDPEPPDG